MRTYSRRAVAAAVLITILAGLPANVAAAPISRSRAAHQFLRDGVPLIAAAHRFSAAAATWGNAGASTRIWSVAHPFVTAMENYQNALLTQSWPKFMRADVRALYQALAPVEADIDGLRDVLSLNISAWEAQFETDWTHLGATVNIVRHDLGLKLATGY